jgi:ParB-like chromosome segregation protein Spo0J
VEKTRRQIRNKGIDLLKAYDRNARTHSEGQISQIMASLKEFGWTNPVLIDGESGVIAGHARIEAAKRLGLADERHVLRRPAVQAADDIRGVREDLWNCIQDR